MLPPYVYEYVLPRAMQISEQISNNSSEISLLGQ